ncbi:MAG: hypothetical protein V3V61_02750 [Gammaproteobacteria bacterium]
MRVRDEEAGVFLMEDDEKRVQLELKFELDRGFDPKLGPEALKQLSTHSTHLMEKEYERDRHDYRFDIYLPLIELFVVLANLSLLPEGNKEVETILQVILYAFSILLVGVSTCGTIKHAQRCEETSQLISINTKVIEQISLAKISPQGTDLANSSLGKALLLILQKALLRRKVLPLRNALLEKAFRTWPHPLDAVLLPAAAVIFAITETAPHFLPEPEIGGLEYLQIGSHCITIMLANISIYRTIKHAKHRQIQKKLIEVDSKIIERYASLIQGSLFQPHPSSGERNTNSSEEDTSSIVSLTRRQ